MYNRDKIIQTLHEIHDESKQIKPYVTVAQPRRVQGETPAQKLDGYDGLHIDMLGFSHAFVDIYGEKVDVARNYLIEKAIESGAKYLLFVGEDTVLPYDGFKILHETAEKNPDAVVVGVYYIKCSDAMIMVRNGDWITIPNVDPGQVFEAWQTGMDAMLVPVKILEEMKKAEPELPFCCIGNGIGDIPFIGEDNFFVYRLRKMGYKLLVNTDVQCLHMDLATGKYTAHPSVDLTKYYTNIKPTEPLTLDDKAFIDKRWVDRLPKNTNDIFTKLNIFTEAKMPIKFNMGAGQDRFEGYINIDKYNSNAEVQADFFDLNLSNDVADEVLASHVIEHIPQHRVYELLTKWYSLIKPKGKLVLELPNLEELCKDFLQQNDEDRWSTAMCMFGAYVEEDTPETREKGALSPHLFGYYPKSLTKILTDVGFKEVKILPATFNHPGKNFRVEATK